MILHEKPLESRTLDSFQSDPRLVILHTINEHAQSLSIQYGKDSATYPPGHSQYSPFFSGQYSTVVGDNLRDLFLVIEGHKSLKDSHLTQKDILMIRQYILASHEKLIPIIGNAEHQKAVDILGEIIITSDFEGEKL
jgi:hypothetical protein